MDAKSRTDHCAPVWSMGVLNPVADFPEVDGAFLLQDKGPC
jgi:hypothetical protein